MNGSVLARIAYLKDHTWYTVGYLHYFRTHEVRIRLKTLPLWAMMNNQWMLGTFLESFKVSDPPYLSGDIVVKTKEENISIGRVETYQNATGSQTYYNINLHAVPATKLINALANTEKEGNGVWLDVELGDKEV